MSLQTADPVSLPAPALGTVATRPPRNLLRIAVVLIVTVGVGMRIASWIYNKSYWFDELQLLNEIQAKSWTGVFTPLGFSQSAPVLFIAGTKLAISLAGNGERATRFLPLLASIASVLLAWPVLRRMLSPGAALVGLLIFALSAGPIYYASELKQYSLETCVTVILLLSFMRLLEKPECLRYRLGMVLIGALSLFASLPAVFVCAACGIALAWAAWRGRIGKGFVLLTGFSWTACLALNWLLLWRHYASDTYFPLYWAIGFMPMPPRNLQELSWIGLTFNNLLRDVFALASPLPRLAMLVAVGLGIIVCFRGVWRSIRHASPAFAKRSVAGQAGDVRAFFLAAVVGTLAWCLVASALHKYPIASRLMQFSAICLLIFAGLGLDALRQLRPPLLGNVAAGLLAAVALLGPLGKAPYAWKPLTIYDARGALEIIHAEHLPGDTLWVEPHLFNALWYYQSPQVQREVRIESSVALEHRGARGLNVETQHLHHGFDPVAIDRSITRLRGRTWVVLSGLPQNDTGRAKTLAHFAAHGRLLRDESTRVAGGVWLYLYDLNNDEHAPTQ